MKETNGRDFFEGERDADSLAAVARAAARRARDGRAPAQRPDVEEFMRAQEEFNRAAAGSLKLVARHLQFLQARLDESEKQDEKKKAESSSSSNAREEPLTGEHVSEISRGLADLCARFEGLAARLSEIERKLEAERAGTKRPARAAAKRPARKAATKRGVEASRAGASRRKRGGRGVA